MMVNTVGEKTWIRAAQRAWDQEIDAVVIDAQTDTRGREDVWIDVDSASTNGSYRVRITTDADGVQVECGCTAGQHEVCCKHAAAALSVTQMWWAVQPIQADAPEPQAPAVPVVAPDDAAELRSLGGRLLRAILASDYAAEDAINDRLRVLRGRKLA